MSGEFKLVSILNPQVVLTAGPAISAGTSSQNTGTIVFSNSNGVSFGLNAGTLTASAVGGGGGGSFSAGVSTVGNTLGNTGTVSNQIVLAGGNNITLSQSTNAGGATVTISGVNTVAQTNQTVGVYASSQTYGQSSSSTVDARSVSYVGSGGVSVGLSGGSILISGQTTTPQTVQTVGVYASSQTYGQSSSSTIDARSVSYVGSGGVSVGLSGGSVLISGQTTTPQTAQTVGVYASSQTYGQSSSSTVDARSVSYVGSGGVSVGLSGGSVLISGQTTTPQTNQTVGMYAVSNTTGQSSSSTFDARSISFDGAGVASIGFSNGSVVVSVPSGGGAGDGVNIIAAGTQTAATTGTVLFQNSNGLSFGMSNSSVVTASYTVPSTAGLISAVNVSAGTTSNNLSALTFANSNGLSFGLNASTITASYTVPTQTAQTVGLYASSQTYGQSSSSTVDARSISVVGSGGVSVGLSGGSFLVSGQTTTPQTNQTIGLYASSQTTAQSSSSTVDARSISIVGQGNISVGLSGGSFIISQTGGGGGVNSGTFYATGNTTQSSSGTIALSSVIVQGTGGISAGVSGGSIIVSGPALTSLSVTGALSASSNGSTISLGVGTVTVSATSNTTQGSSGTINLNGLVFGGAGDASFGITNGSVIVSVTQSNQAFSAAGGSSAFQTLGFSDNAHLSWTNTNGSVAAVALKATLFATSNTTQSSSGTQNVSNLIFAGAGAASVAITNGSVVISAPNAGAGNVTFSAGANSSGLASVIFSNSNGVSFGLGAGSVITASVNAGGGGGIGAGISTMGNTAGTSGTVTTGNVIFVGTGPVSLSQSSSGSNATISINAPATSSLVGASGISISTNGSTISVYQPALSYYANADYPFNSQSQTVGQSTSVLFPFRVRENQSMDFARLVHSISMASTSFGSTANTTYSYNQAETHNLVLYTKGTGASSLSLQSIFSTSIGMTSSAQLGRNSTNNISVSNGLTYGQSGGTSSVSFSYAATNSSDQFSTTHMTALTGVKLWDTQFGTSLSPGQYFLAYGVSSTQTTQGTANLSANRLRHSHIGISLPNNTSFGQFGSAANQTLMWISGIGSFTTAGGGTTASLGLSNVSSSASHVVPWIQMLKV